MNKRQALKAASQRIEELEDFNRRAAADIKAYNRVIDGMIDGISPCEWCMEYEGEDCPHKGEKVNGCSEWWLKDVPFEEESADDSEGIHGASPEV